MMLLKLVFFSDFFFSQPTTAAIYNDNNYNIVKLTLVHQALQTKCTKKTASITHFINLNEIYLENKTIFCSIVFQCGALIS